MSISFTANLDLQCQRNQKLLNPLMLVPLQAGDKTRYYLIQCLTFSSEEKKLHHLVHTIGQTITPKYVFEIPTEELEQNSTFPNPLAEDNSAPLSLPLRDILINATFVYPDVNDLDPHKNALCLQNPDTKAFAPCETCCLRLQSQLILRSILVSQIEEHTIPDGDIDRYQHVADLISHCIQARPPYNTPSPLTISSSSERTSRPASRITSRASTPMPCASELASRSSSRAASRGATSYSFIPIE